MILFSFRIGIVKNPMMVMMVMMMMMMMMKRRMRIIVLDNDDLDNDGDDKYLTFLSNSRVIVDCAPR